MAQHLFQGTTCGRSTQIGNQTINCVQSSDKLVKLPRPKAWNSSSRLTNDSESHHHGCVYWIDTAEAYALATAGQLSTRTGWREALATYHGCTHHQQALTLAVGGGSHAAVAVPDHFEQAAGLGASWHTGKSPCGVSRRSSSFANPTHANVTRTL